MTKSEHINIKCSHSHLSYSHSRPIPISFSNLLSINLRPYLHKDINLLERVQRRYTKHMNGLVVITYGHVGCPGDDHGLSTVVSRIRRNGVLVQRRAATNAAASTFNIRAPSSWNNLPMTVV